MNPRFSALPSIVFLALLLLMSFVWSGCEGCAQIADQMGMGPGSSMPPTSTNDNWSFLPDYQPGESVYEGQPIPPYEPEPLPEPPQVPEPPSQPEDTSRWEWQGGDGIFWFGDPDNPPSPQTGDLNPKIEEVDLSDTGSIPLVDPEPIKPEAPPVRDPGNYFEPNPDYNPKPSEPAAPTDNHPPAPTGTNFLGGYSEPEPKEIDYGKYGDQTVFDPQRAQVSVVNSSTGAVTDFRSHPFNFGEMYGGTIATTTLDGKIVHEDHYDRLGNLVKSVAIHPTGNRTTTQFNRDGTQTVTQTHADGTPVVNKASATDPKTGETTTAEGNPDGTRTVTTTDEDGNVIKQETTGEQDENVLIEGSSTDPETGITTSGTRLKDGTTQIIKTDAEGNVIDSYTVDQSGKKLSQAPASQKGGPDSAGDSFAAFDAFGGGPMGQLIASQTTPTGAFDTAPSARSMSTIGGSSSGGDHAGSGGDC